MVEVRTEERVDGVRSLVRSCAPEGQSTATEAVVFQHGNPGSSEDWSQLSPEVGQFARAIAPDMPGYGKADRPKHFDYTVPGYARHLVGLLAQLGVDRVHLVLRDFGGVWGLQFASEHPERVASLTLVNVGVMRGHRWHLMAPARTR
jgi:pimeloyl-ACP methyl ester carboxylesterase